MKLFPLRFLSVVAIALILPLTYLSASQAQTGTLVAQTAQNRDLQSGRPVVSGDEGQFVGQVLVNVPAEMAWQVLTDYDNFENFLPGVASSQLLASEGNRRVFEQVNEVRVAFFNRRTRVRLATTENFPRAIDFQLVEGDVESVAGSWQIDPVPNNPNQVVVTHRVNVDPGPDNRGLFFNIYRNSLRDTLGALKQEMERRAEG
ncbi:MULTISPECIES: SRPBCC family protein [unclassified Leptolyngbya]|uniref:SRPBCC family protein n=1 Tax=unclassified Leptolyngbya TaxID=2650499 RepID=UPI00168224AB|nr:SRPBCC family protein [Leptolyngbya sp. FACHB-8]MBD2154772.1 SRPBCC family protein [Leptolyngbya sp. FACHB-16]